MKVVVMGVAGSGKSTLGAAIARELGYGFIDADDLHPQENIEHMRSGQPLTDAMRWPWLDASGVQLRDNDRIGFGVFRPKAFVSGSPTHLCVNATAGLPARHRNGYSGTVQATQRSFHAGYLDQVAIQHVRRTNR